MSASVKNRTFWNSTSDAYQQDHGRTLEELPLAWGVWRIPESDLRVLGVVEGRRVLELGCGAAQWTSALMARGARAVGVDLSEQQLAHARARAGRIDVAPPLVQGDAERLPFLDHSFDVVFCDHGATTFASPPETIAEASRVLMPGGIFAFCMSTPIRDVCSHPVTGEFSGRLEADYFSLAQLDDGASVTSQLPYGSWIRLFRQNSLWVEDLVELRPPSGATTSYQDFVPLAWATKWPAEHIWKLRKR